ncbi:MAG: RNA polymerase sigma-70 factor [Bacteroidota bacterium]|nr:RNA polymerase sigma-70 factor [Bacteroidota bacterium]
MSIKNAESIDFLVNGQATGDYEIIFKKYFPALKAYAQLFVHEQVAEDIVQDILVYLWENRGNIQIHTSLEAYFFKSVYQRCISHIKRQNLLLKHHSQIETNLREEEISYFDSEKNEAIRKLFMNDLQKEISSAIDSLPPKCREVFEMSFLQDYKNKEISEKLAISVNTVESHITNALKALRGKLAKLMP